MEDPTARIREMALTFKVPELKEALRQLGLSRTGKKQDLVKRLFDCLAAQPHPDPLGVQPAVSDTPFSSAVQDVITQIFRGINGGHVLDSPEAAANGRHGAAKGRHETGAKHAAAASLPAQNIRCSCGVNQDHGELIQCEACLVWQHLPCTLPPEKPLSPSPIPPDHFLCELCRIEKGDPYCVPLAHPLFPRRLVLTGSFQTQTNGTQTPVAVMEHHFSLTRQQAELMRKPHHCLQIYSVLLADKTSNRMHWPAYSNVQINGNQIRVTNRPGQQLLGSNGRDDGPQINELVHDGRNLVTVTAGDERPFVVGVRIIRRKSFPEVMGMIQPMDVREGLEVALQRIERCIGGGGGGGVGSGSAKQLGVEQQEENEGDSDSDLQVMQEAVTFSLRCPMTGSRIKEAGRFQPCAHMGCFDLPAFVQMNQRARKWQCPICMQLFTIADLIRDSFFNRVCSQMSHFDSEVTDIELRANGHWRPKFEAATSAVAQTAKRKQPLQQRAEKWRDIHGAIVEDDGTEGKGANDADSGDVESSAALKQQTAENGRWGVKRAAEEGLVKEEPLFSGSVGSGGQVMSSSGMGGGLKYRRVGDASGVARIASMNDNVDVMASVAASMASSMGGASPAAERRDGSEGSSMALHRQFQDGGGEGVAAGLGAEDPIELSDSDDDEEEEGQRQGRHGHDEIGHGHGSGAEYGVQMIGECGGSERHAEQSRWNGSAALEVGGVGSSGANFAQGQPQDGSLLSLAPAFNATQTAAAAATAGTGATFNLQRAGQDAGMSSLPVMDERQERANEDSSRQQQPSEEAGVGASAAATVGTEPMTRQWVRGEFMNLMQDRQHVQETSNLGTEYSPAYVDRDQVEPFPPEQEHYSSNQNVLHFPQWLVVGERERELRGAERGGEAADAARDANAAERAAEPARSASVDEGIRGVGWFWRGDNNDPQPGAAEVPRTTNRFHSPAPVWDGDENAQSQGVTFQGQGITFQEQGRAYGTNGYSHGAAAYAGDGSERAMWDENPHQYAPTASLNLFPVGPTSSGQQGLTIEEEPQMEGRTLLDSQGMVWWS